MMLGGFGRLSCTPFEQTLVDCFVFHGSINRGRVSINSQPVVGAIHFLQKKINLSLRSIQIVKQLSSNLFTIFFRLLPGFHLMNEFHPHGYVFCVVFSLNSPVSKINKHHPCLVYFPFRCIVNCGGICPRTPFSVYSFRTASLKRQIPNGLVMLKVEILLCF